MTDDSTMKVELGIAGDDDGHYVFFEIDGTRFQLVETAGELLRALFGLGEDVDMITGAATGPQQFNLTPQIRDSFSARMPP